MSGKRWIVAVVIFVVVVVAAAVWWLSRTPGLPGRVRGPEEIAPAKGLLYCAAGRDNGLLAERVMARKDMKKTLDPEMTMKLRQLLVDSELAAMGIEGRWMTPEETMKLFRGSWLAAVYAGEKKKTDSLFAARVGLRQRIALNLLIRKKGTKPAAPGIPTGRMGSGNVGGATFAMAGGWLIASTKPELLRAALTGAGGGETMAREEKFTRLRKAAGEGPVWGWWYAPGKNATSKLTAAKIEYGELIRGTGALRLRFVTTPESSGAEAGNAALEPWSMMPKSLTAIVSTTQFGRLWDDLLLGRSIQREKSGTFLKQFYELSPGQMAKVFPGDTAIGIDGVLKLSDGTPAPNLIFIFNSMTPDKGMALADRILGRSMKEQFKRKVSTIYSRKVVSYVSMNSSAAMSPSVSAKANSVIVTMTLDEMKKVLSSMSGFSPCLKDRRDIDFGGNRKRADTQTLILLNGPATAAAMKEYFTLFADLSSKSLAEFLRQVAAPGSALAGRFRVGIGRMDYSKGLLIGEISLYPNSEK